MRAIVIFAACGLAAAVLSFPIWFISLGYYEPAEHWLRDVCVAKEHHAASISEPKIIIVSGSNALFGMDSPTLERLTGKPVANLATHGGLPLDFHIEVAKRHAKRGDLVVMPLEFSYFHFADAMTGWHVSNMSSWGHRFIKADLSRIAAFYRHATVQGTMLRLMLRPIPSDSKDRVLSALQPDSRISEWRGYSYRSLNRHGDFLVDDGSAYTDNNGYTTGATIPYVVERLRSLRNDLALIGAELRITWQVSMRNPEFDLTVAAHRERAQRHRIALESGGLRVICNPEDFQFERELFLNTPNHLRARGAVIRTEALAACLEGRRPDRRHAERLYAARVSAQ